MRKRIAVPIASAVLLVALQGPALFGHFGATLDQTGVVVELPIGQENQGNTEQFDPAQPVISIPPDVSVDAAPGLDVAPSLDIAPAQEMKVHFIDVGQGDSIFMDYGTYEMLVDAGGNSKGTTVVNYIKPYVDGDLDLIIATHVHEDHIGGIDTVLGAYSVASIIDSGDAASTITYSNYLTAMGAEENCEHSADQDLTIDLGGPQIRIIETGDGASNVNNDSVITMIDYNDVEILLPGDAEDPVEVGNSAKFIDVDIMKAAHHGSYTGLAMLGVTKPETIIISAAQDNQYGHPHLKMLQKFFGAGASVYGTFKSGTIVVTTDGNTYSLNTVAKLTEADAGR